MAHHQRCTQLCTFWTQLSKHSIYHLSLTKNQLSHKGSTSPDSLTSGGCLLPTCHKTATLKAKMFLLLHTENFSFPQYPNCFSLGHQTSIIILKLPTKVLSIPPISLWSHIVIKIDLREKWNRLIENHEYGQQFEGIQLKERVGKQGGT